MNWTDRLICFKNEIWNYRIRCRISGHSATEIFGRNIEFQNRNSGRNFVSEHYWHLEKKTQKNILIQMSKYDNKEGVIRLH